MMKLTADDKAILAALSTDGGFVTGEVSKKVVRPQGRTTRTHSAAVRQQLLVLEGAGLVRKLDDQKPVCWVKTDAGAAIA